MNESLISNGPPEIPKPIIKIHEKMIPNLSETKIGQSFKGKIGFKVIEKTKSFMTLSINSFSVENSKRIF